jgi:CheY-like chemotaxis protein
VLGVAMRLEQVFVNLLLNAAHAIEEGRADGEIVISATARIHDVVVEITDNGHGIEPKLLPRIFEPFVTTKGGAGVGLGLSICRDIVLRWGGKIEASSVLGSGTTLRVTLPLATSSRAAEVASMLRGNDAAESAPPPPSSIQTRSPASSTRPLGVRRRVLVIDDEPLTVSMTMLAFRTHDVVGETDALAGLDHILGERPFDLILCDLMMPGLTGMDIYERVARERPGVERSIVFMSGGAYTERARSFLKSLPNRLLLKPLSAAKLEELLSTD